LCTCSEILPGPGSTRGCGCGEIGTIGQSPERNHDVESTSPTRTVGPYYRFSARHGTCAQELLPRLKIVDPAHPEAPLRPYQVPRRRAPEIVGGDFFRSFNLSFALHQNSIRLLRPRRRSRRCRGGWLDHRFLSRRPPGGWRLSIGLPRADSLSRPIPWVVTYRQIAPHGSPRPFIYSEARLRPFVPSSRGSDRNHHRPRRTGRGFPRAVDRRPAPEFTRLYWIS